MRFLKYKKRAPPITPQTIKERITIPNFLNLTPLSLNFTFWFYIFSFKFFALFNNDLFFAVGFAKENLHRFAGCNIRLIARVVGLYRKLPARPLYKDR